MTGVDYEMRSTKRPMPRSLTGTEYNGASRSTNETSRSTEWSSTSVAASTFSPTPSRSSTLLTPFSSQFATPTTGPRNRYDPEPSTRMSSFSASPAPSSSSSSPSSSAWSSRLPPPMSKSSIPTTETSRFLSPKTSFLPKDWSVGAQMRTPSRLQPRGREVNEEHEQETNGSNRRNPSPKQEEEEEFKRSDDHMLRLSHQYDQEHENKSSPRLFFSPFRHETKPTDHQEETPAHDQRTPLKANEPQQEQVRAPSPGPSEISTDDDRGVHRSDQLERVMTLTSQREALYAFRKQMRDCFGRMDEMVDLHRDLFKSDPSTGIPIFNRVVADEAERMATQTFDELASLRTQFHRLTEEFAQLEAQEQARDAQRQQTTKKTKAPVDWREEQDNQQLTDDDETPPTNQQPSPTSSNHVKYEKHQYAPSIASSSDSESNQQEENVVVRPPRPPVRQKKDTGVFDDFDKRMEEIRSSLNAIAHHGAKTKLHRRSSDHHVTASPITLRDHNHRSNNSNKRLQELMQALTSSGDTS